MVMLQMQAGCGMSYEFHSKSGRAPGTVAANHLAGEISPYLLQHAHNPVDWYPWNPEALDKARRENKPIFLSIGYSSCHWCHVMERESFEDPAIADVLNKYFVCIKVDREERPDLDEIYMTAVQMMTGSGGWPMSVFLTPDLKPFFAGTYYPPEDRYGRIGFKNLLLKLIEVWNTERTKVLENADDVARAVRKVAAASVRGDLTSNILLQAIAALSSEFDATWGGFGGAPKFPPAGAIAFLLRQYTHHNDARLLKMATVTLDRMASGGMYDQIGGGFHRYSTDEQWRVPHFEKMLYDNALLAGEYLEAFQVAANPLYRRIAMETLDYVLRDMSNSTGGFYSSEDADSEGVEGRFYLWTEKEILNALGENDGRSFCGYYGVTPEGNFEARNILHLKALPPEADESRLAPMRGKLLEARSRRVRPARDDKILASWNGLMISAFARGYRVLGDERYRQAAEKAAIFILTNMMSRGQLLRSSRGGYSKHPGYLDDYAFMADALVDLYEVTGEFKWLDAADRLVRKMIERFQDRNGGFYFTETAHVNLLARMKNLNDSAEPSGNAVAARVLMRLGRLLDRDSYRRDAEGVMEAAAAGMRDMPRTHLFILCALDFQLNPGPEIVVAGRKDKSDTRSLWGAVSGRFLPNSVMAVTDPTDPSETESARGIPLLADKTLIDGKAAIYVCKNYACRRPLTNPAGLRELLP